jgi:TonB family protein
MKTRIFSSLIAVLLLGVCLNQTFAQDDKLYSHVSLKTPPSYPGGIQKFYEFLGGNIKYPEQAVKNNVQETVYLAFIVEKNGAISDIKVDGEKVGYGLEEEAVRVMKLSKHWNPGMENKKPVRVKYNLPVKFAIPGKPRNPSIRKAPNNSAKADNSANTIYSHVSMETPPTYPGGIAQFYKALMTNMEYPKAARDAKIQGTVYLSFVIEKDGSLADIKTDGKKLGGGTDEEAIRVLKLAGKWNPGLKNGKPVRVKYNVPVKFTMHK